MECSYWFLLINVIHKSYSICSMLKSAMTSFKSTLKSKHETFYFPLLRHTVRWHDLRNFATTWFAWCDPLTHFSVSLISPSWFCLINTLPKLHFGPVVWEQSVASYVPRVSQGSFFQEQMSSPVRRMAWSWCRPSLPPRVDCQWQKLFNVWSAWWLIAKPSCEIQSIAGGGGQDTLLFIYGRNRQLIFLLLLK